MDVRAIGSATLMSAVNLLEMAGHRLNKLNRTKNEELCSWEGVRISNLALLFCEIHILLNFT